MDGTDADCWLQRLIARLLDRQNAIPPHHTLNAVHITGE
jgi:hypothetical protein